MEKLTNQQHDQLSDTFYKEIENPAAHVIKDILKHFNVFIWGDYIASTEIFDTNNEPSLTGRDLLRMEEAESIWIDEKLDEALDEGMRPTVVPMNADNQVKLVSSEIYPVDPDTVSLLNTILPTFDAFIMNDTVWCSSYFKHNLEGAWEYQMAQMEAWEECHED